MHASVAKRHSLTMSMKACFCYQQHAKSLEIIKHRSILVSTCKCLCVTTLSWRIVQGDQAAPCELEACPKMGAEEGKAMESDWQLSICFWTQAVTMAEMAACSARLRRRPWYITTARENATWNRPEPKEVKAESCIHHCTASSMFTWLLIELRFMCTLSQDIRRCR